MINEVVHIGLTVSDMDQSIKFYRDVLGLKFLGELVMEGPETDELFNLKDAKARVAYLNGSEHIMAPSIELIQFINGNTEKEQMSLFRTCISEICFKTDDIETVYKHLINNGVQCLSKPQNFDFTKDGFSKSKAIYFKDPDGIILELMEYIK